MNMEFVEVTETPHSKAFYYFKNDDIIGDCLRYYGEYSEREIQLLLRLSTENSVVYDIGANIGAFTVALANKVKKVYAFEPNPKNFELLKKNTEHLNNVVLFRNAVGSERKDIFVSDFDESKRNNYGEARIREDQGVPAKMIRLDDINYFLKDDVLFEIEAPSLIKIDVEGHEYDVFRGGIAKIIAAKPILFFEASERMTECFSLLEGIGYGLNWYPVNNFNPNNFKKEPLDRTKNTGSINIISLYRNRFHDLPPVKNGQEMRDALQEFEAQKKKESQ